jgi:predicted nucleic acid-binding protein
MRLFVDTGPLLAAVLPRDPDHDAAVAILRRATEGAWTSVHTSDFVLAEALNFIRMKVKRAQTAEALVTLAFGSDKFPPLFQSVSRVHSARFAVALDHYQKEFGRGLSLTDWTSVVIAQDEGLDEIATFDDGFRALLRVVDG